MPQARHRKTRYAAPSPARATGGFGAVLRVREFRVLWLADLQSSVGDQLARVALSVLVYRSTGSGFLTAGVYALTYLPALLGSIFLGTLADRLPRRGLLIAGDVIRAALLAAMALPALPLPALTPLLVVVVVVGTPWKAAESALVSEILAGERYVLGVGLRVAAAQIAQLAGFGLGGLAVAAIGPHAALLMDACTFAMSAALITFAVQRRPGHRGARSETAGAAWLVGIRTAFRTARLRLLLGLVWLAGLVVVPEGLAAPYAHAVGGGPGTVGLLLAANPAGLLIGTVVYTRWLPPQRRISAVGPMAALSCLPLIFLFTEPGPAVALPLLAASGLASAYQTQTMSEFVLSIPPAQRGQAIAFASAGLLVAQGLGLITGGAIAQLWRVGPAIAVAGAAGALIAVALGAARARDARSEDRRDSRELSRPGGTGEDIDDGIGSPARQAAQAS